MPFNAPPTARRLPPLTAALAAGFLAITAAPLFAQTYTFTQVDAPNSTFTEGRAINDKGQIVGDFKTADTNPQTIGFSYNGKKLTTFLATGSNNTEATGVNKSGRIVGFYYDGSGVPHGFIYENKLFETLDPNGSMFTLIWGINGSGDAVGSFIDQQTPSTHGFLYVPAAFETIDDPLTTNFGFTGAFGVNNLGDVTGLYGDGLVIHGFTKIGGTYTTIDPPGSVETHPLSINTSDQVAGFFVDTAGGTHGFLLRPGVGFTVLDPPGSTSTTADGINADGQVVGYFTDAGGCHGFVYTPEGADGTYAILDPPGADGSFTLANGINKSGQVVGEFNDAAGSTHAFIATPSKH